jgi:hypothetical protein
VKVMIQRDNPSEYEHVSHLTVDDPRDNADA